MSFRVKVFLALIGACGLFWIGVIALIQTGTSKITTDEQRICAYLIDHSLPQTWRYAVDELHLSSDLAVATIEDARAYTCPTLRVRG